MWSRLFQEMSVSKNVIKSRYLGIRNFRLMLLLKHCLISADFTFRCGTSVQLSLGPVFDFISLLTPKPGENCYARKMERCLVNLKNSSIVDGDTSWKIRASVSKFVWQLNEELVVVLGSFKINPSPIDTVCY